MYKITCKSSSSGFQKQIFKLIMEIYLSLNCGGSYFMSHLYLKNGTVFFLAYLKVFFFPSQNLLKMHLPNAKKNIYFNFL